MEGNLWLGILFAIIGSTNMNVGKAIQKWKVRVLGHGRKVLSREHRRDFSIWVVGICLTASVSVFYSLALKYTDKSSMVSSLSGIGMIGLVVFAWLVLKEKVGLQELGGAALVLAGTTVMGYFESAPEVQRFSLPAFFVSTLVLLGIFGPAAVIAWRTRKLHGLTFGALAGVLLGISVIIGDMALVRADNSFLGQLSYPYPYGALAVGTSALVVTQFAFWRAKAMVVVPTINSFMILSPLVLEYFTFGAVLRPVTYVGVASIIAGVVLLTATDKQDRISAPERAKVSVSDTD